MKQEWKSFIESLPVKSIFLHKDEFENRYHLQVSLPAIFISENEAIKEIISKPELESCQSLQDLKKMVKEKLEKNVQHHHPDL
jgi:hypothetical protein